MESLFCKRGSKKNSISKGHLTYVWTFFFLEMCSISAWSILYVRHSCVLKNFAKWHCHAHYGNYTKFSAKTRIHDEEESYARKWPQFVCSQVQQLHDFQWIQRVSYVCLSIYWVVGVKRAIHLSSCYNSIKVNESRLLCAKMNCYTSEKGLCSFPFWSIVNIILRFSHIVCFFFV